MRPRAPVGDPTHTLCLLCPPRLTAGIGSAASPKYFLCLRSTASYTLQDLPESLGKLVGQCPCVVAFVLPLRGTVAIIPGGTDTVLR